MCGAWHAVASREDGCHLLFRGQGGVTACFRTVPRAQQGPRAAPRASADPTQPVLPSRSTEEPLCSAHAQGLCHPRSARPFPAALGLDGHPCDPAGSDRSAQHQGQRRKEGHCALRIPCGPGEGGVGREPCPLGLAASQGLSPGRLGRSGRGPPGGGGAGLRALTFWG